MHSLKASSAFQANWSKRKYQDKVRALRVIKLLDGGYCLFYQLCVARDRTDDRKRHPIEWEGNVQVFSGGSSSCVRA